jgi:hypothetical protein
MKIFIINGLNKQHKHREKCFGNVFGIKQPKHTATTNSLRIYISITSAMIVSPTSSIVAYSGQLTWAD